MQALSEYNQHLCGYMRYFIRSQDAGAHTIVFYFDLSTIGVPFPVWDTDEKLLEVLTGMNKLLIFTRL